MAVETRPVQQADFYTSPARDSYYPLAEAHGGMLGNREFNKFVNHCLQSVQLHGINAFHNGETSHPPLHHKTKEPFTKEVTRVIGGMTKDLFGPDGTVLESKKQEWQNITRIAPRIVEIFSKNTNYLYSINRAHSVNLLRFGVDVARDPSLLGDTEINIAIGGSDDQWSTSRLPAYVIPGVSLARDVKHLYEGLTAIGLLEEKTGKTLSHRDEEVVIAEVTKHGLHIPDEVQDDDVLRIQKKNGIAVQGPRVVVLSGASAARAINRTMDEDAIIQRNADNLKILRDYVDTQHPDVSDQVDIVDGLPWPEASKPGEETISSYTRTVMDYLADELDEAEESEVKYAVDNLKKRGERRGGEAGKKGSMLYAASHPKFFDDRLNLPFGKMLDRTGKQPRMVISLGGKTEKQFDIARDYLSRTASVDKFQRYLWDKAIPNATTFEEASELVEFYWTAKRWKEITDKHRETYSSHAQNAAFYEQARVAPSFAEQCELLEKIDSYVKPPLTSRADLPEFGTIQFLVKIGENATYYAIPHIKAQIYSNGVHEPRVDETEIIVDRPYGYPLKQQLEQLHGELEGMKKASQTDKEVKKKNLLPIEQVTGVIFDLEALVSHTK